MQGQQLEMFSDEQPTINSLLKKKVDHLLVLKSILKHAKDHIDELEFEINQLEGHDLPALLDELQLDAFTLNNGTKVALNDKSFTYVNVPEREKGWEKLKEKGYTGIIKPVIKITVSQDENKKSIKELLTIIDNSIEHEKVELNYEYSATKLSSAANEMELRGIDLEADIFKKSAKRGVKITESKSKTTTRGF